MIIVAVYLYVTTKDLVMKDDFQEGGFKSLLQV